jgi:hypothetical protein
MIRRLLAPTPSARSAQLLASYAEIVRAHGRLSFETAEFSPFEGGLLSRHTVVLNMLDLARQIGAVPRAGTVGDRVGVWMEHVAAFWARARQA